MFDPANPKPLESLSFREAVEELDSIVSLLESNTLELEQSIVFYERGVKLLGMLQVKLDGAQQKVDVLMGELNQEVSDELRDTQLS